MMCNLCGLVLLSFLGVKVTDLSECLLNMATSGLILCLLTSFASYTASFYVEKWKLNPNGQSGSLIKFV